MYSILLALHNILRWFVLILAILALVRAFRGWLGKREWQDRDRKAGIFFTIAVDTQLLIGLLLYLFFSEFALKSILDKGLNFVLQQTQYRFFSFEHSFFMLTAVVFAHLGSVLPRKVQEAWRKHQRAAIFFTLALLAVLLGIPWSRPLLPSF